jgi:Fe-Mn family superoxide dismutase
MSNEPTAAPIGPSEQHTRNPAAAGEARHIEAQGLELPPLPYGYDALEPHISRRTLEFHHDKHHRAYVDKTNELIAGTDLAGQDLPAIIRAAREKKDQTLLNQAGQAWNHDIFWKSMAPNGGGQPSGRIGQMIQRDFGGLDQFKAAFKKEGTSHFASGWAWLVLDGGKLAVTSFHDGDAPVGREGITPLLTCDLWEHAYYLDYQNKRAAFLDAFLEHLINWEFAERCLPQAAS